MWGDLKRRNASAARRDEYRRDHREIVTALRLRDADRVATAMRTHLARVSRHLLGTELRRRHPATLDAACMERRSAGILRR